MTKEDPDQLINVGPYLVPIGQLMSASRRNRRVRFTPNSRPYITIAGCPLWANSGLMRRSK
jgi:hypothetical protein